MFFARLQIRSQTSRTSVSHQTLHGRALRRNFSRPHRLPNEFTLTLSSHDFQKISEWDEEALRDELIAIATSYAREQTYVFLGPVSITFTESSTQPRGKIEVSCHTRRGSVAPATTPTPRHKTQSSKSTENATSSPAQLPSSAEAQLPISNSMIPVFPHTSRTARHTIGRYRNRPELNQRKFR